MICFHKLNFQKYPRSTEWEYVVTTGCLQYQATMGNKSMFDVIAAVPQS